MEYLEERFREPALLPADPVAASRRRGSRSSASTPSSATTTTRCGAATTTRSPTGSMPLPVGESLYVDFAFLPWVIRLRELYGVELPDRLEAWLGGARGPAGGGGRARARAEARVTEPIGIDELVAPARRGAAARRAPPGGVRRLARRAVRPASGPHPRRASTSPSRSSCSSRPPSSRERLGLAERRRGRRLLPQRLSLGDRGGDPPEPGLPGAQLLGLLARVVEKRPPARTRRQLT